MDVIKKIAADFTENIRHHAHSLQNFDYELGKKLITIKRTSEKMRFLSYVRDIIETKYQEHAAVCGDPERCGENKAYEIALYGVQQEYDDYYENAGGQSLPEKPAMQFFNEGQYFDAFTAIKERIKEARSSIILIDGYVDENTLAYFPGKEPSIKLTIITSKKCMNDAFTRAAELYNKQYENLHILHSENYHDRFLIIDNSNFYHIGASIKDAGNRSFMFTRIDGPDLINAIRKKVKEEFGNDY